jgi:phosphoribosylformimino-5-aminoimidazole carboxamide ribotide isomerase
MVVIPAIDVKDGRCVRLRQGDMDAETVYGTDIPSMATRWVEAGATIIHLVDLNGAVEGEPRNLTQIEAVIRSAPVQVQVGGGIRNMTTVRRYFKSGISRIVLGTGAFKGWTSLSETTATHLLKELAGFDLGAVIYTDIARDGMLSGPNIAALREILTFSAFPVIASGGISTIEDLQALQSLRPRVEGAIVGKALYDGKLDYREAVAALRRADG